MVPESSVDHYRRQQHLTAAVLIAARREWARLGTGQDFDIVWRQAGTRIVLLVEAAQRAAAVDATAYIGRALDELGLTDDLAAQVAPSAFAGVASDGRPLETLLYEPVIRAKQTVAAGQAPDAALLTGRHLLDMLIETQVADAGRAASSVAIAGRPSVGGFVRMLQLPSCARCVVLAGKFFKWNEGFRRHPRCDCRHIPVQHETWAQAEGLVSDPLRSIRSGQVTGLSAAERRAILDDGADAGQVINAQRGMYTATAYGRRLKSTTEGTTSRAVAGRTLGATRQAAPADGDRYRRARTPRLRPEEIYRLAGDDRTEAIRLLTRFGYLI